MSMTITVKLEKALFIGAMTVLACVFVIFGLGAWHAYDPDTFLEMPGWVALVGVMAIQVLPLAATYSFLCVTGIVYMDWKHGQSEDKDGHTIQFTVPSPRGKTKDE